MHDRHKWSFLIPAAGQGQRLGLGPKAVVELAGRPLLDWAVDKACVVADDILVAVPRNGVDNTRAAYPQCTVIGGGETRQDSIEKLLDRARHDLVLIHDVVRPFATIKLMEAVAAAVHETGAAGAFGKLDVPVAVIADGQVVDHFDSKETGLFQSPLAFRKDLLIASYAEAAKKQREEPSTIGLVLAAGFQVRAVAGERANIKITDADDLSLARFLSKQHGGADL